MAIPDLSQRYERVEEPVPFVENEEELARELGNFEHFQQSDEYAEKRALGQTVLSLRRAWAKQENQFPSTQPQIASTVNGVDITEMSGSNEGPEGVHTISTGRGDPGGVSYGKHQLMSKRNSGQTDSTMDKFVASKYASNYREDFEGLVPGSQEFSDVYARVAKEDPENFEDAQTQFILDTHYEPLREWATEKGFDTEDAGIASALYSISVQHGGWKSFLKGVDTTKNKEQVIKDIYDARTAYVNRSTRVPEQTKKNIARRYRHEAVQALNISNNNAPLPSPEVVQGPVVPNDNEPVLGPPVASLSEPKSFRSDFGQDIPDELNQRL